jgi:signal transduction histidine kinase
MLPEEGVDLLSESGKQIPQERLEAFLRLLTHDIRNDLNAVDLLCAYVQEIASDEEVITELGQVRAGTQFAARRMLAISRALQRPEAEMIEYPVQALVEDMQQRFSKQDPKVEVGITWQIAQGEECVSVDGTLVFEALLELLNNAVAFMDPGSALTVSVSGRTWRILQPNAKPGAEDSRCWGMQPLVSSRRGHYGLGLYRTRRILAAQNALLSFRYEDALACWVSEVIFDGGGRI